MITVVTICSENYLAHAKTLGESLLAHNPEYCFVVALVGVVPQAADLWKWDKIEILPIADLKIAEFADMHRRYSIVELNTAVKPHVMEYLYRRDSKTKAVVYMDPDILVLAPLAELEALLDQYSIILTPHCCSYNERNPAVGYELSMLETGVYNLGFLATARSDTTMQFLSWWKYRLVTHCYYHRECGYFVDQFWIMLVPLYFEGTLVLKNMGYNVSYWNLFERVITGSGHSGYRVNKTISMLFYHFSSYDPNRPAYIANRAPRVELCEHPELVELFAQYRKLLMANGYETIAKLECAYYPRPASLPPPTVAARIRYRAIRSIQAGLRKAPSGVKYVCRGVGWLLWDSTRK